MTFFPLLKHKPWVTTLAKPEVAIVASENLLYTYRAASLMDKGIQNTLS
jgi:hypothetical protein